MTSSDGLAAVLVSTVLAPFLAVAAEVAEAESALFWESIVPVHPCLMMLVVIGTACPSGLADLLFSIPATLLAP